MRDFFRGFVFGFNQSLDSQAGRVGLTPRAFRFAIVAFWALFFSLLFAALPARAQVASLCGSGKVCSSSRFVAKAGTAAAPAFTFAGDTDTGIYSPVPGSMMTAVDGVPSIYFRALPGYISSPALNSNIIISETATSLGTGTQTLTCTANYCTSAGGIATGAAGVGTAFGSFPAAAGSTSKLLYDSTGGLPRYSDGTFWRPIGGIFSISGYFVGGAAGGDGQTVTFTKAVTTLSPFHIATAVQAAGSGAGNFTVDFYDSTQATVLCTSAALSCAAAKGSLQSATCTDAYTAVANDNLLLRVNGSGCTTMPAVNVIAMVR